MLTLHLIIIGLWHLLSAAEVPLVPRATAPDFGPVQFRVTAVRDERPGQPAVARLLPASGPAPMVAQPVELRGGTVAALQQFVGATLPAVGPGRYAVTVRVLELQIREAPGPSGAAAAGTIALHLAFEGCNAAGQALTLTEYRATTRYGRLRSDRTVVETALGQALLGSLRYFNGWLAAAAAHDARLATAVQPTFDYDTRQTEPDTLFYDPARPLVWADFRGSARSATGPYAAAIFPSFGYQVRPQVRNGVVELAITLQVFVVRSASWVAPGQHTVSNLNHEQRHFDLVRLVAERFRRKVGPDSLTVADYQSILGWKYLDSFREMNRLQEAYDQQTHNGTDAAAQQRWNQRIAAELREFEVVK